MPPSGSQSKKLPSFADLLQEATGGAIQIDIQQEPGVAFRALFDGWVKLGGTQVGGRDRRSVRQIKVWLGAEYRVRSLETKLAGRTILRIGDIFNLIRIFIKYWRYNSDCGKDEPYPIDDYDTLIQSLGDEISSTTKYALNQGLKLPLRSRTRPSPPAQPQPVVNQNDDTLDSGEAIESAYRQTDALITVSREQTFIGTDTGSIMADFQSLMDRLRHIDQKDNRFRTLIWIVDLGRRQSDPTALSIIHNLEFLATQFRSLLLTQHKERELRSNWFRERAIVIVGTLLDGEIEIFYRDAGFQRDSSNHPPDWITSDRLFFKAIPDEWVLRVAREGEAAILQRTVTVHRNLEIERTREPGELNWDDLQYFFHAPLQTPNGEIEARCVEMPRLSVRWSDAFRTAHEAALTRLGRQFEPTLDYTPEQGLGVLRDHRLAVLTAEEFCGLTNKIAFGKTS